MMRKAVFLCGVSGAGKTTAGKRLMNNPVLVVELDQVVRMTYSLLSVGNDTINPYRFDHWQSFLSANSNNLAVLNAFREHIFNSNEPECINLLLIGNHYLIPSFEQALINTLTELGFQPPLKLLLDINWLTIYFYRKKRGTLRDRMSSKKDVLLQLYHYRKTLRPRGYMSVNANELNCLIRSYFQLA